jgi:hypothetical protein
LLSLRNTIAAPPSAVRTQPVRHRVTASTPTSGGTVGDRSKSVNPCDGALGAGEQAGGKTRAMRTELLDGHGGVSVHGQTERTYMVPRRVKTRSAPSGERLSPPIGFTRRLRGPRSQSLHRLRIGGNNPIGLLVTVVRGVVYQRTPRSSAGPLSPRRSPRSRKRAAEGAYPRCHVLQRRST